MKNTIKLLEKINNAKNTAEAVYGEHPIDIDMIENILSLAEKINKKLATVKTVVEIGKRGY
jgi:predicted urease superfamily metal-dependent hydrolase